MYSVGELDKRVTIKREVEARNRSGGYALTTTDIATVWAHVRPKSGREIKDAERVSAQSTYLFVIRFRENIYENDRLVLDDVEYNIRAILSRGKRNLFLEIDAERGVAQ